MEDPTTMPENTVADLNSNPTQPEPDKQISDEPAQPGPPFIFTPPPSLILAPPPPSIQPSFRPVALPPAIASPQFTPVPTVNYRTTGVPMPGVSGVTPMVMPPVPVAPAASMPVVPYAPMPNGYPGIHQPVPHGTMPPPAITCLCICITVSYVYGSVLMIDYGEKGWKASLSTTDYPTLQLLFWLVVIKMFSPFMGFWFLNCWQRVKLTTECSFASIIQGVLRYPSPYAPMIRPAFLPRPMGFIPPMLRPPVTGIRGPITSPSIRLPAAQSVTPKEKPQTTVYVGKISTTVENDFILSLLQLCGTVKSWKRPQNPTNGTLKGYGFCEFESAEGVLRALRLLNKLSVDGQELMLNVNQATREYLKVYVDKKVENSKNIKESETEGVKKKGRKCIRC
ncbi:RNA-binding protein 25 [Olea europaea subsp. europaea]|uniref:RNA-binding protein 25 n=1 Tax=Olea europaea subsp. europaea TaxID=158383 RepID=A0A8S0RQT2_OLEEU|nr:RNA-binding protein 25 [Olea europaea subsp. europaea]